MSMKKQNADWYGGAMKLTIGLERKVGGRWIEKDQFEFAVVAAAIDTAHGVSRDRVALMPL